MSLFTKSYFVRATTDRLDGTHNENWTVLTISIFDEIVSRINKYRHDLENEHGGTCMITELRRL